MARPICFFRKMTLLGSFFDKHEGKKNTKHGTRWLDKNQFLSSFFYCFSNQGVTFNKQKPKSHFCKSQNRRAMGFFFSRLKIKKKCFFWIKKNGRVSCEWKMPASCYGVVFFPPWYMDCFEIHFLKKLIGRVMGYYSNYDTCVTICPILCFFDFCHFLHVFGQNPLTRRCFFSWFFWVDFRETSQKKKRLHWYASIFCDWKGEILVYWIY